MTPEGQLPNIDLCFTGNLWLRPGIDLCNLSYMKLKEKDPIIVLIIRNGCFKGSDQIRRIPSVQSKMHHDFKHVDAMNTPLNPKII